MSQTQNKKPVINLDYQASKPVDERVVKRMLPFFDQLYGNPSSLHTIGDVAEDALTKAREQIASFLKNAGIKPASIFHSGKERARETAEIIGNAIGIDPVQKDSLSPLDDPKVWAERIKNIKAVKRER